MRSNAAAVIGIGAGWPTTADMSGTCRTRRHGASRVPDSVRRSEPRIVGEQPVRDAAHFRFESPEAGAASIDVFDVTGRRVARLAQGPGPPDLTR